MKTVKHTGRFHLWPYCCAEEHLGNDKFKKVNWLWFCWMFCFD
jgi:hypothetical protein